MADERAAALREQVQRLRRGSVMEVELKPASAYEAVTRQMVESLAEEIREMKGRLDGMLWMVAGSVLLDVVLRLAGV